MASLVEVAKLADVSITTASRVLSGSDHPVSEEKRVRVLQAAGELSYSPSGLAQAMVTGTSHIVGVIVGDATDPYFAWVVRGVEDTAREHGYLVIVCNSDRVPEVELTYLRTLNDYRVDGVIFAGGGLSEEQYLAQMSSMIDVFNQRKVICVSLAKHLFPAFPVMVDNRLISHTAVDYLVSQGHRRIAYISGPKLLVTSEQRLTGFEEALGGHGIQQEQALILRGDYTYDAGVKAALAIHEMELKPTAVLASNDVMAIGCLTELKELDYRIPEDISVMGIDDIPFAKFVDPALTTIALPLYELGKVGMESLLKLRKGEDLGEQGIILPHALLIRKSVAGPKV